MSVTGLPARQVGPEVRVRLEYRLCDAEGAEVEAPGPDEPIEFIFGVGQAPPAIERGVDGLALGESRRVELAPGEAFGPRDEAALIVVDRAELPAEAALGDELEAENEAGETVHLRVVELGDEVAQLDANHPLAGQRVSLELRVIGLWAASASEVEEARAELERQARDGGAAPDVPISSLLRRPHLPPEGRE